MYGFRIPNEPWMQDAKCHNDKNLQEWQKANREDQFFDEFSGFKGNENLSRQRRKRAEAYCRDGCEVFNECLSFALQNEEQGIWAGTTARQRRSMKSKARKAALEFLARQQAQLPDDSDPIAS